MVGARTNFLRRRGPHEHSRVTFIELFFDLVFVFAITQLSHLLLHHLSLAGAIETSMLFIAVWLVWIYTCWFTNWLDPERTPVRLMLLVLMLAGLVLSTSLPEAFGEKAVPFALAFAVMQLGRNAFTLWAVHTQDPRHYRNYLRITAWLAFSAVFWISGAFADHGLRLVLWGVAVAIEFASPSLGYWTPGLGRSTTADWGDVEGAHMAERCALFVIIALGESILMTGVAFAEMAPSPLVVTAFVSNFLGSVAMWWIYFDAAAERASEEFANSDDPGHVARLAYTYLHIPLVAGIVVSAVSDELALAHPVGHMDLKTAVVMLAGPGLYLFGDLLFRRSTTKRFPRSHLAGLAALIAVAPFSLMLPPIVLSSAGTVVLLAVAIGESIFLRRERLAAEGAPSAP